MAGIIFVPAEKAVDERWEVVEVTPHNFLPLSSHDFVVIQNSYVHKATKKVGYKI